MGVEIARRAAANLRSAARRGEAALRLPRGPGVWLCVRLAAPLDELPASRWRSGGEPRLALLELLETLEAAAADPGIDGVLLRLEGAPEGFAVAQTLRRAVLGLRDAGVPVVAYAETLDAPGMLLASAAAELFVPESGALQLVGLRLEGTYLAALLAKLHVAPEIVRVGTHKSAGERLTRDAMSMEEREQLELLADDVYGELVRAIAAGRGRDESAVRDWIDRGPYRGAAAREAGLVDRCLYPDEIEGELERLTPAPAAEGAGARRVRLLEAPVYHRLRVARRAWEPLRSGLPRLAYLVGRGAIRRRGGARGGIACDAFAELLEHVRRDEAVRGVVLRLDSPGGEVLASDLLWRCVERLRDEKPVVVSMGEVLGSGGYYLAAPADALLAEATTLTGSIGVVGGKANLEGLYRRLGVGKDAVERGARAGLLSETRGFTSDERAALRAELASVYAAFVERVSRGRGIAPAELEPLAQGRIWSGARALRGGLVDAEGGPLEALREVRRRAGIAPGEPVRVELHPRHGPPLRELLGLWRSLGARAGAPG